MKKRILTVLIAISTTVISQAQVRPSTTGVSDTTRRSGFPGASARLSPKPYGSVITDKAITRKGMITTHKLEDKFYFEIADTTLARDILVVSRIAKSGAEIRAAKGYAGDVIGSTVIRFEKGPNNRIFMRKVSFKTFSPDSTTSMYQSLKNSNIQPIAASFSIAAFTNDKKGSVIDVTDYINNDNDIFFFGESTVKSQFRLGPLLPDRSYIQNVRSFPLNVEISTVKTYTLTGSGMPGVLGAGGSASGTATLELNTSLLILPKKPMKGRYVDPRVGYFNVGYTDFDLNPQGVKEIALIKRWRLEPKPDDLAKYKKGELVEPKKQIVYYIDPTTPKKWVPYLKAGVNDWAKAFEKAGFKNAIVAKEAPTFAQDSTWSIDDARHSAIVYKPSEVPNASGPSISDPRSGEIMESHINWYHNVQKLVHDWYMIQAAAIDPRARQMTFSDELMGELIRFVSSHEIGHTLGLLHNYGSSSTVPVENLRNKKWVEENGHTPSIMDYARFNYVAQPEDNINKKGIYPRIGDYDKWAIQWGYTYFSEANTLTEETVRLKELTLKSAKNKRLWFGTETNPDDPRSQSEDLGDNAMKASDYGIKNLKVILANLAAWTKQENEGYDDLANMYGQLVSQYGRYMGHVAKNIGGVYETPKMAGQPGLIYERTPAAIQREAIGFLSRQLFTTPKWLADQQILDNIDQNPLEVILAQQAFLLYRLLSNNTLNNLVAAEATDGAAAYKITDLFSDLNEAIFTELKGAKPGSPAAGSVPIDVYRRNLQKSYVDQLISTLRPAQAPQATAFGAGANRSTGMRASQSDVLSMVKGQLADLNSSIKSAAVSQTDLLSKYHLMDLSNRIQTALDPDKE